ncbi:YhgE/Pip domain-containing protein [Peribacillus frigoritolerans]|uniref:YhgE/Pip domain-containing protein n=1 Tax=Peribacillus frigoritolerans TaxID=450367 RepID=UPI001F4FE1CB|nr:YhgE/Pip family protein [Peribacillus frigoritolerans]MCK2019396.1 YhgE/Pip family protein [Peribacillus frigoritolerans]
MCVFKSFFSQKRFWGSLLGIIIVVMIFSIAFIGSIVNPAPKDLPVALVINDKGAELPNKTKLNAGEQYKQALLNNKDIPIKWSVIDKREEVVSEMNEKKYYAAIVIPENMSQQIMSLQSPSPHKPEVEVIINQGMNYTAANTTKQIIDQLLSKINVQIQDTIFTQLEAQKATLTPSQAKLLSSPLEVKSETINKVGDHTANGNAPVLFTQIVWIAVIISSVIHFVIMKKITNGRISIRSVFAQLVAGLLFATAIASTVLLFTDNVLNVKIPDLQKTFLFLLFTAFMFYLLQNAILNWLGLVGVPLFILLFLFSIPVLNLPPEFLPTVTQNWFYSWVPFKYSVEGLRNTFFFGGNDIGSYLSILGMIGLASLIIMSLSILKTTNKERSNVAVKN